MTTTGGTTMTFGEARMLYAESVSRDTVRDRAIVRAVNADMGLATVGLLLADLDWNTLPAIRDLFVATVEKNTKPVELPRGVLRVDDPRRPGVYLTFGNHGERLVADVREDGHTYIGDERID